MAAPAVARAAAPEILAGRRESSPLWATVSTELLSHGERRLEASTFLTDGFGLRQGVEALSSTVPMSDVATVWQPSRLKGFQVDGGKGLPFLSAGQVFERQSRVRKSLAEAMITDLATRYLDASWLLLSCSGEVGRVTAVYEEHLDKVITHDLLRVVPLKSVDYGWLYAYMKTPTFFAISRSAQYGHMIKHLEAEHVQQMPVAMPKATVRWHIGQDARNALEMRQRSRLLQKRADELYGNLVNPRGVPPVPKAYSTISSAEVSAGRRRLEGQFHRSDTRYIEELVRQSGRTVQPLAEVVKSVSMAPRFKRYFGRNGTPYRSAAELFDVNTRITKRIYSGLIDRPEVYMLRAGEMIMARSGQAYGLLGRTMVLTTNDEGTFGSEDLIRIVPDEAKARTGYLQTVLNHIEYGRPRVVRYASGTSVPHLDPLDIRKVLVPRFDEASEDDIAELSDEAIRLGAEADRLESAAVEAAENIVAAMTGRRGAVSLAAVEE